MYGCSDSVPCYSDRYANSDLAVEVARSCSDCVEKVALSWCSCSDCVVNSDQEVDGLVAEVAKCYSDLCMNRDQKTFYRSQ